MFKSSHFRRVALAATVVLLAACGGADDRDPDRTSLAARQHKNPMFQDTMALPQKVASAAGASANGAELYGRCAACHQSTGLGMPGTYPPLAGSEWVTGNPEVPIRIVLHGLQGPITVKGTSYNNAMTPFADQLSDEEIAAILTYERSNWGNNASAITAEQVKTVREATKSQTTPWHADDLKGLLTK
jgi:mono/diheme cytochrome c family protein